MKEYGIGAAFPDTPVPKDWKSNFYYESTYVPVFIDHYWLKEEVCLRSSSVCCLDFSVAKEGKLVAYGWEKGVALSDEYFFG